MMSDSQFKSYFTPDFSATNPFRRRSLSDYRNAPRACQIGTAHPGSAMASRSGPARVRRDAAFALSISVLRRLLRLRRKTRRWLYDGVSAAVFGNRAANDLTLAILRSGKCAVGVIHVIGKVAPKQRIRGDRDNRDGSDYQNIFGHGLAAPVAAGLQCCKHRSRHSTASSAAARTLGGVPDILCASAQYRQFLPKISPYVNLFHVLIANRFR
jgi:hypothetical protein